MLDLLLKEFSAESKRIAVRCAYILFASLAFGGPIIPIKAYLSPAPFARTDAVVVTSGETSSGDLSKTETAQRAASAKRRFLILGWIGMSLFSLSGYIAVRNTATHKAPESIMFAVLVLAHAFLVAYALHIRTDPFGALL